MSIKGYNQAVKLNRTVWATIAPSRIHSSGVGVIAIRDIPTGTLLTDHITGASSPIPFHMTPEEFTLIHPAIQKLILDRTAFPASTSHLSFYSPNTDAQLRSFMNHSSTPNSNGTHTLRDIQAGEEITEDYASFYPLLHPLSQEHYKVLPN